MKNQTHAPYTLQVLFKMDRAGEGQQVLLDDLSLNRELSFVGFTHQMFVEVHTSPPSPPPLGTALARPVLQSPHICSKAWLPVH